MAGLATAPLLTQHLGVAGRGELGAAMAPNALIVGAATLGLPDAVAYLVARRPDLCRAVIGRGLLVTGAAGAVSALAAVLAGPVLAGDDPALIPLIAVAAVMAVPALMMGVLRGAAGGQQRWDLVARERAVGTLLRLSGLVLFAIAGYLTVLSALLVSLVATIAVAFVYRRLGDVRAEDPSNLGAANVSNPDAEDGRLFRTLLVFGTRVWLGGVATILVARVAQLLIVPLSDVKQLGLYAVAVTVSDIPWIVVQAVRDVVFGSSAAERNDARMLATSRAATMLAAVNSLVLGLTLPWWLGSLFGADFTAAEGTTWILLASSVVAVPGLVAGAGVAAAGRPGARSVAIVGGLAVDVAALVMLVPGHGAFGAAVANLLCTATTTTGCMVASRSLIGIPTRRYVVPTADDGRTLLAELRRVAQRYHDWRGTSAAELAVIDTAPQECSRQVEPAGGPKRLQVFVHLPYDFDAKRWNRLWKEGLIPGVNEPYPYGYHHAEDMGCRIEFSIGHMEGRLARLLRLGVRALLGFDFVHAWRNRHGIRTADAVWTHTENHSLGVAAVLRGSSARPATIMQSVWLVDRWRRTPRWRRSIFRRLLSEADVLTFLSRLNRDAAAKLFPGVPCEVVPFGIRVDDLREPAPRTLAEPVRVLSVGNDEHRDWETALRAIGGRDGMELRVASQRLPISRPLPDNVTVGRAHTSEELSNLYCTADIVLVPLRSNLHASGLTVLQEAAVFGVPVIASDVGGLDDYFGSDDVVWVPEGDAEAIAGAIEQLGRDPERRRDLALRAQSRLGNPGIGSVSYVRRHVELSREILSRRGPP